MFHKIQAVGIKCITSHMSDKISVYMTRVRKVNFHHVYADREIFYAYYGNTAVTLILYL